MSRCVPHADLLGLIAVLGDAELLDWTSSPTDYVLVPGELPALDVDAWRLSPVGTGHPMAVWLVRLRDGTLSLPSVAGGGLQRVLAASPEAFLGPDGAELLVSLLGPTVGAWALVSDMAQVDGASISALAEIEPPAITLTPQGILARVWVVDDAGRLLEVQVVPGADAPVIRVVEENVQLLEIP